MALIANGSNYGRTLPTVEDARDKLARGLGSFSTYILKSWARRITDSLFSDIVFVTEDAQLKVLWDQINRDQDMLSYFKEIETNTFLFGKQFTIWEPLKQDGKLRIWFDKFLPTRPCGTSQLGSDRMTAYLGYGWRQIVKGAGGMDSQLTVLQLWTKKSMISYQMGVNTFGSTAYNNVFITSTPKYIEKLATTGALKWRHRLGVLPVAEIYNRAEFEEDAYSGVARTIGFDPTVNPAKMSDWDPKNSPFMSLCDWAPVYKWLDVVDYIGTFLGFENLVNHTRIVGKFSASELNSFISDMDYVNSGTTPSLRALTQNLFVQTTPNAGAESKVFPSEFKGVEIVNYANELIAYLEKLCNFGDSNDGEVSNYETQSKTKQRDSRFASFIRQKNKLRTTQIKRLILDKVVTWALGAEYVDKYAIRIVSNILQDELDDLETLKQHAELGTLDQESLIESANKDKTPQEIETIKGRLKDQHKAQRAEDQEDAQFSANLEQESEPNNEV